jgi:ATP-dependent helicase/nuclease subunit B
VSAIDRPSAFEQIVRPRPSPRTEDRPRIIRVTDLDRLKADPFAFYARKMLRLSALDPIDADPSSAWRGSAVHAVLEAWMKEDDCDPAKLRPRAEALLAGTDSHPLMRALWQPRLLEAIDWIAEEVAKNAAEGRKPLRAEAWGEAELYGVTLQGIADRIDRAADGSLAIVDYKTGMPPGPKAVREGYAMQLGLLGLIAERGGFRDVEGIPAAFEYWSLAKRNGSLGFIASPVGGRNGMDPSEFVPTAARNFEGAARKWLTGDEPFTAKLHPEYAPFGDYDQLMRLDEWYGREA